MSVEPGRGKFVDQAAGAGPSIWCRTAGQIREEILYPLGGPARLEGAIASGQLIPCPTVVPVSTFWIRSAIYWRDWMSSLLSSFHSRPWTIDYHKPGRQRRLESRALAVLEVRQLIREENVFHFLCSTADIQGISALKPMDYDIRDIDEFLLLRCRELTKPMTEEHPQKNVRHWELRLDRMLFAEYPQAGRRLYWLDGDDPRHFGTARYQACRLGTVVSLTDRPYRYSVNVPMISAIRQQWRLFAVLMDELFSSLSDAMDAFECPFGNSGSPRYMHGTDKSGTAFKLV